MGEIALVNRVALPLEKLAALVPLPRVHLVRYGGCLAPHSHLRGASTPTPRQQGVDESEASSAAPHWSWARLLKRVFALAFRTIGTREVLSPQVLQHRLLLSLYGLGTNAGLKRMGSGGGEDR